MKPTRLLAVALVLIGTALCARLGFWQLSRLAEKRAANAALAAALASAPETLSAALLRSSAIPATNRRLVVRGTFDERRHVLLGSRVQGGLPGVMVVTPLRLADDSATTVLIERGWLYAADAARARPQDSPEPGERVIVGLAHAVPRVAAAGWFPLEHDSVELWSARALDPDSIRARWPDVAPGFVLRELPGPGVPERPLRTAPHPLDEMMHLSYAIQWFLFGAILLIGSLFVSRRRERGTSTLDIPPRP